MSSRSLGRAVLLTSFLLPLVCCAADGPRYEPVALCKVLNNPGAYANKRISLRGSVYMGMENTNISDGGCPGKTIELRVGDDVYEHADIRAFHRKISGWKMHGYATVAGTFTVTDSAFAPYVLDVESVSNITREK